VRHGAGYARMILVVPCSLWCSLSVQSAGPRIELIRFSLLIVLTVALLSVAFRIHSHPSSSAHGRTPAPQASPSVPTQVLPSSATRTPAPHPHATGGAGNPVGAGSHGGSSTPSGGGTPAVLPVTGWGDAVKLGAFAFVLIGGGTLSVRAAGPRRQRPETVQD